jgi:hypothetical protein
MPSRLNREKLGRVTIYQRKKGGVWWVGYSTPAGARNYSLEVNSKEVAQKRALSRH